MVAEINYREKNSWKKWQKSQITVRYLQMVFYMGALEREETEKYFKR
jgi:hypothetical protein